MGVSKVVINRDGKADILMDLTNDTISSESLVVGFTAHDKTGEVIEGVNPYVKADTDTTVNAQSELIQQIKTAIGENVGKTTAEVEAQTDLIQQIKTALEGKAGGGGGTVLPTLANPGTASDLAEGKELIDANGNVVTGTVGIAMDIAMPCMVDDEESFWADDEYICSAGQYNREEKMMLDKRSSIAVLTPISRFGNAKPEDVRAGVTFTSESGLAVEGTGTMGGGMVVKSGTTTSRTINTGLSDVEQFFMYKESQTGTGLIHLHYTKSATSRMYASAWSTNNYGSKTITNGTGGVTVSGGTVTISATQAAQGALTSNVTYKWIAVGAE